MTRKLKIAAATIVAATSLVGCFPEDDYTTPTRSDVIIEGKLADYYKKPVEGLRVIMYRKMDKDQNLLSTVDSLICDTAYTDATGLYSVCEENRSDISLTYGIHISDTTTNEDKVPYRTIEQELFYTNAIRYEYQGRYQFVFKFSPIIYPSDWPGFQEE